MLSLEALSDGTARRKRLFRSLFRLLRLAVAVGLIASMLYRVGWQPLEQAFNDVLWWWVVSIIIVGRIGLLLVAIRWKLLLAEQSIHFPTLSLYKRMWIARFFSNFLPGQTGADVYRVFGDWGVPLNRTVVGASVVFDRIVGLIGLLIIMSVVGLVNHDVAKDLGSGFIPAFSLLAVMVLLALVTTRQPLVLTHRLVPRCPSAKLRSLVDKFLESMLIYVDRRVTTLLTVAIALAFQFLIGISVYLGFLALGVEISLMDVVFITLLVEVITMIPLSANGWGVREGAFVLMYEQIGIVSAEALAVALLTRVLGLLTSSIGGVLYMIDRRGKRES